MVKIIVPLLNGLEYTKKMVASVKKYTPLPHQLVLVDNGSVDGTRPYIQELAHQDPVHYRSLLNESNKGYAGGMNTGLKAIIAEPWEYALFFNNDVIVTPRWLEKLIRAIEMPEDKCYLAPIGMAGPVSNFAGGKQGVQVRLSSDPCEEEIVAFAQRWETEHANQFSEVSALMGLCLLVKREVIERVGMFDEQFFPGMWEDQDICKRSRLAGYKHVIAVDDFVWHFGSKTIKEGGADAGRKMFDENRARFYAKWNGLLKHGQPKPVVGMLRVRNQAKYIQRTLDAAGTFCKEIVVLDGKSDDGTYEICRRHPKVVRVEQREPPIEKGGAEADDRNLLLQMAKERNPCFLFAMDGDEIFEARAASAVQHMLDFNAVDIDLFCFHVFTFWDDEGHYRADGIWGGMMQGRLFRNLPNQKIYYRKEMGEVHCGSHPFVPDEARSFTFLRLKHFGYVDRAQRERKYKWYTENDRNKSEAMILGGYSPYYKKLYYGTEQHIVEDKDFYRHLIDEKGMVKKAWSEDNSVCLTMIAKNEEERIAHAINSVRPIVQQVVLVDTGSTDKTVEIAKRLGAEVYHYPWRDDFSGPRNLSLRVARTRWILRLDADEYIDPNDVAKLWWLAQDDNVDVWVFTIHNYLQDSILGSNAKWAISETCRMYKNDPRFYFQGLVHEEIDESVFAAQARGEKIQTARSPVLLYHEGYLKNRKYVKDKLSRYFRMNLAQAKLTPDKPLPHHALALQYFYDYHNARKALKLLKIATQKDSDFWMGYHDAGVIYTLSLDFARAAKMFRKAQETQKKKEGLINPLQVQQVEESVHRLIAKNNTIYARTTASPFFRAWIMFMEAYYIWLACTGKFTLNFTQKIFASRPAQKVLSKIKNTGLYRCLLIATKFLAWVFRRPSDYELADIYFAPYKLMLAILAIRNRFYDVPRMRVKKIQGFTQGLVTILRTKQEVKKDGA